MEKFIPEPCRRCEGPILSNMLKAGVWWSICARCQKATDPHGKSVDVLTLLEVKPE